LRVRSAAAAAAASGGGESTEVEVIPTHASFWGQTEQKRFVQLKISSNMKQTKGMVFAQFEEVTSKGGECGVRC
jgi:hypothetical protein